MVKYKIESLMASSTQYGNCDICGKPASEVFLQNEERYYNFIHNNKIYEGWTTNKCYNYFGHKECLLSKRR